MAGNDAKPKSVDLPRVGAEGAGQATSPERLAALSLASLGVVFGDIGTSPLYAFRQSLAGASSLVLQESNVLGVLSLILWALILVISLKYLIFMLRADNDGEGEYWFCWPCCSRGKTPRFEVGGFSSRWACLAEPCFTAMASSHRRSRS